MQVGYSWWCDSCFATITPMATTNKSKMIFFMRRHSLLRSIISEGSRYARPGIRVRRGR